MLRKHYSIAVLLSILLFLSCQQQEKEMFPYLIAASVQQCEGCQVELKSDVSREFELIDTAIVENGKFRFKGGLQDTGFYQVVVKAPDRWIYADVYLPADSVNLTIDVTNQLRKTAYRKDFIPSSIHWYLTASTSPVQAEMEKYQLLRDSLLNNYASDMDVLVKKFGRMILMEDPTLFQIGDSINSFKFHRPLYLSRAAEVFLQKNLSPEATLYAMLDNKDNVTATENFRMKFNTLPAAYQQSHYGKYLDKTLQNNELPNRENQRLVGSRIVDLDLMGVTTQGKEADESIIIKNNKLTLVKFWATWNNRFRTELPKYKAIQNQYCDKGFSIIAVSLDYRYSSWINAVNQLELDFHHVSELNGIKGDDALRFFIKGVPANMLLDSKGRIIAVDISPEDLKNKLQESI